MKITLMVLFALLMWLICLIVSWVLTESKIRISKLPMFRFQPFLCFRCCSWWLTLFVSIFTTFVLNLTLSGVIILTLAILTAISMYVSKNNDEVQL